VGRYLQKDFRQKTGIILPSFHGLGDNVDRIIFPMLRSCFKITDEGFLLECKSEAKGKVETLTKKHFRRLTESYRNKLRERKCDNF
jgi:hypothetical protein